MKEHKQLDQRIHIIQSAVLEKIVQNIQLKKYSI